jgi:hypothetical protein
MNAYRIPQETLKQFGEALSDEAMLDELHSTLDLCLISEEGEVIFAMQLVKAHREMAEFMERYAEKEDYLTVLDAAKGERDRRRSLRSFIDDAIRDQRAHIIYQEVLAGKTDDLPF